MVRAEALHQRGGLERQLRVLADPFPLGRDRPRGQRAHGRRDATPDRDAHGPLQSHLSVAGRSAQEEGRHCDPGVFLQGY